MATPPERPASAGTAAAASADAARANASVRRPPSIPPPRGRPDTLQRLSKPPSAAPAAPPSGPTIGTANAHGRAASLAALRGAVERATTFRAPQLVTVVGNQGVGKSRLINEFVASLPNHVRAVRGRARKGGERRAALVTLLRDRFELADNDLGLAARARFAATVRTVMATDQIAEMLHFIGGFVGIDYPPSPFLRVLTDTPRQADDVARTVLRRFIEVDARVQPLVLVLDDMQWADEDTLIILKSLADGLAGSPIVIVVASRPELLVRAPNWGRSTIEHTRLDLRNLEPDEAEHLYRDLLSRCGEVPDDIVERAVEMTGGNPYFLEQLVRLMIANGTLIADDDARWRLDIPRARATELPITIEEAIEARIDALDPGERDLLEKAAVFGNVFWVSALVAMRRHERPAPAAEGSWRDGEPVRRSVVQTISSLAERDYLLSLDASDSSMAGDVEIVFKHNLERDFIVRNTPTEKSQRYHRIAAQWLDARTGHRTEEQLEFLAGLYERGGDLRSAARCYLLGAMQARGRSVVAISRDLFERGLAALGDDDAPAKLDALHDLGDVLDQAGLVGHASARFTEMLALAWRMDHSGKAGAAHRRLARIARRSGDLAAAERHLAQAQTLFSAVHDERGLAAVLDERGRLATMSGSLDVAIALHGAALECRRELGDKRSIAVSLSHLGSALHDAGDYESAIAHLRESLELRRQTNDLVGVVQSLCDLSSVYQVHEAGALALEALNEAGKVATRIGDRFAQIEVWSCAGDVLMQSGRLDEAEISLVRAIAGASELGDRLSLAVSRRRLAEVELARGEIVRASASAEVAFALSESFGQSVHLGASHRVRGDVAAANGDDLEAEADYQRSIKILENVKHQIELARSYRSYARFHERSGRKAEAMLLWMRADKIFAKLHSHTVEE